MADKSLGAALARLLYDLGIESAKHLVNASVASWAASFALACHAFGIPRPDCACAYLWAWIENQVGAAVKLVPLGQTSGQRIRLHAATRIPDLASRGLATEYDALGAMAPGVAVGSALHETQYTRLFRS